MRTIFTSILILTSIIVLGQKIDQTASFRNIESESFFRICYDNDYFSESDRDYTQGYSFEISSSSLIKNPINKILFPKDSSQNRYGLLIEHIGFTPKRIGRSEIQFEDRPFAAAIMIKSYLTKTKSIPASRFTTSMNIGVIGPLAFGKAMQTGIHRLIDGVIPKGWDNQIQNDIVINYGFDYEKQLISFGNIGSLQADFKGKIGTLYTNSSAGLNLFVGKVNSPFSSHITHSKFQIYGYAQTLVNAIVYDATLQGGVINNSSTHTFSADEIERITYQLNYGVVIKIKNLYLEYSRAEMSREIKNGQNIGWGGIKIGFKI